MRAACFFSTIPRVTKSVECSLVIETVYSHHDNLTLFIFGEPRSTTVTFTRGQITMLATAHAHHIVGQTAQPRTANDIEGRRSDAGLLMPSGSGLRHTEAQQIN